MTPGKQDPPPRPSRRGKKGPCLPIPFDRFLAEAEQLKAKAIEMLRQDGHHAPLLILFTDADREVVGLRLAGDRPMHEVVKAVVQARQARAFVCITEAWMTRGAAASLEVPPSQHPDREQILCISAIHPEGKTMWVYPFASEGGRVVIGPILDSTRMTLGGGIPNALGEEGGR